MTELYYVEDDAEIAGIVKKYLQQKNFRVTVCDKLADFRKAMENHVPDLILLDLNLPDGRGEDLCRRIRNKWKELPIIFITVQGDSRDIVSGFRNGADDYVVKPFELEVLYARMVALLRRSGGAAGKYLACGGITIDQNRRMVSSQQEEINLTASEYQLLLYLMQNKGKTVTREKILEQVWDVKGNYVSNNTLTVTMKRLRDKLHQPPCLKTVRSVGYRMEDTI